MAAPASDAVTVFEGEVVKGFGRGSKDLGIPTANLDESVIASMPESMGTGIYYGWAQLVGGDVHKAVMSVGWNPFYKNEKKSFEVHIMKKFDSDFYGQTLRVVVLGFIRPEKNFPSLDALIEAINGDIAHADKALDESSAQELKNHTVFKRF